MDYHHPATDSMFRKIGATYMAFQGLGSSANLSHETRERAESLSMLFSACWQHEHRVHYSRMKNITLSADEHLIEQARLLAKSQHKTLNAMFREWLEQVTAQSGGVQEFEALMKRLKHVQAGRRFTRDQMNER